MSELDGREVFLCPRCHEWASVDEAACGVVDDHLFVCEECAEEVGGP